MTLTREQTERLARMIAVDIAKNPLWDEIFDPINSSWQFAAILRAHYIRASKANLDNLRDVMMCGHGNLTDWRAAVLVKIAEVG